MWEKCVCVLFGGGEVRVRKKELEGVQVSEEVRVREEDGWRGGERRVGGGVCGFCIGECLEM